MLQWNPLEISNNVPFKHRADFSSHFGRWLLMEFIPKNDPLSQMLLPSRKDIFQDYKREVFDVVFSRDFHIRDRHKFSETQRTPYLIDRIEV